MDFLCNKVCDIVRDRYLRKVYWVLVCWGQWYCRGYQDYGRGCVLYQLVYELVKKVYVLWGWGDCEDFGGGSDTALS